MARQHPFFFAKRMIPANTFGDADTLFEELRGPKREAFLMFLWQEAGSQVDEPLPHVGVGKRSEGDAPDVHKLAVVGALDVGDLEIIALSMPPALEPNEAFYVALVRRRGEAPVVYFYERCAQDGEAVLAAMESPERRANYGFYSGVTLEDFKRVLGQHLGVSLDGLEHSLPEITMDAFMGAGHARGSAVGVAGDGEATWLQKLLLVRAFLALGMWALWYVLPDLMSMISPIFPLLYPLLSLVVTVMFLAWLYQAFVEQRGQTRFGAGMALGAWFIPVANFVLPPLVLRDLWRATRGEEGSFLPLVWWSCWLLEGAYKLLVALQIYFIPDDGAGHTLLFKGGQELLMWPVDTGWIFASAYRLGSLLSPVLAYGGLWLIVRQIDAARLGR